MSLEAEPLRSEHVRSPSSPYETPQKPEKEPWRPHRAFRQAVQDISNIKQQASQVIDRISGAAGIGPRQGYMSESELLGWETIIRSPRDGAAATGGAGQLSASLSTQERAGGKWIKELSSMSNVVVGRCARVLMLKPEELKANFEEEAPASAREPARYARNFLEYCCFRALAVATQVTEHLKDKDFRRWTFDMMLAWEAPGASNQPTGQVGWGSSSNVVGTGVFPLEIPASGGLVRAAGAWWTMMLALLLLPHPSPSTSLPLRFPSLNLFFFHPPFPSPSPIRPSPLLQMDVESSVCMDAFARLAPAIPLVADSVTVHALFELLTDECQGGRLPFAIYNNYLSELEK
ncbi:unnamed protein product [Closterium sp. NIES-54]